MQLSGVRAFLLQPPRLRPSTAATRDLVLQGTWNTRQLGGLPTRGGTVRPNAVFRSDALQSLTAADVAQLRAIPIRTVMDFRVPAEVQVDGPDRYTAPNMLSLPMGAKVCKPSVDDYRNLVLGNPDSVKGFFVALSRPESYPVLYHCHSGKDRTGIMTALLLLVLGTPRDQIMSDYLQSQHQKPDKQVDPSWLQAVFQVVDAAGGIEPFLTSRGVTLQQLQSVRRLLSTPS